MGNNTLTAIVLKPVNADFNEQYRALTTQEGEGFTVGIREYIEGKKTIQDKINALQSEKQAIDSELANESKRLFEQAKQRYNEGGKWTEMESHEGKQVTHAQVSMDENVRVAKDRADRLKKSKDNLLKTLSEELEAFEKTYDSVVWAWSLAYKRSDVPDGKNESIARGLKEVNLVLMDHLHGGGFGWLEPFFENSAPTGSTKNGLYIHTGGQNAKVITAEWYGYDKNKNPVKIDQPVAPGSQVQLHIYTKSMYGHNIRVELKANGKTLKSNRYETVFHVYSNKQKGQPDTTYEVADSRDLFYAEVEVYDYSDPKSIQPPAGTITGHLIKAGDDFSDGTISSLPNVQKAVLNLYVDPAWCIDQKQIVIKPTIHFSNKKQDLDVGLTVNCHQIPDVKIPEAANMPVFVDKIETNFQAFHPCGYSKFEINDGSRTVNLLEDQAVPPVNLFELVAGPNKNTHDITIDLDTDTTECSFDGKEGDHEKHVLTLIDYPEKKIEENAKAEEEEGSTSFDSKFKVQIGGDAANMSHEQVISFNGKLEKYTADGDDKQLKFKARYIYDYTPIRFAGINVHPIFRYFWLGNGVPTNTYMVRTNTCRYQQNVAVKTYPDIAWSLKLSYTNTAVEKELWGNQRYADTKKAKFKREPQKWIKSGDKSIGISLGAKWDEDNEYNATADITEQVKKLMDSLGAIGKFVNSVFLGDENKKDDKYQEPDPKHQAALDSVADKKERDKKKDLEDTRRYLNDARRRMNTAVTDKEKERARKEVDNLQRTMDSKSKEHELSLTRSIGSITIQWPQIEAQFEWSLENIDQLGPYNNQTGVVLQGVLELSPLIGITATLDFLALAQRAHPVALALIAAADITLAIIGDGSQITCELSAAGTFGGKLQGFLNTKTGENSFNKNDRNANDKQIAELKCDLEFKLKLAIELNIEKKTFFVKVVVTGKLGAEATAKWTAKAPIDTDDYGWFLDPEMTFEGLEIKGEASFSAQASSGNGKSKYGSLDSDSEFTWQAIDAWKKPKKWGKFYFPAKKE